MFIYSVSEYRIVEQLKVETVFAARLFGNRYYLDMVNA